MSVGDLPTVLGYAANSSNYAQQLQSYGDLVGSGVGAFNRKDLYDDILKQQAVLPKPGQGQLIKEAVNKMAKRRIVQVYICDPDNNVPLEEALLYRGEPKLTDATDQELFFEIPVKETLDKHNEKRAKWLDKEATKKAGKDVFLEPVKIRNLIMTVTTVAEF